MYSRSLSLPLKTAQPLPLSCRHQPSSPTCSRALRSPTFHPRADLPCRPASLQPAHIAPPSTAAISLDLPGINLQHNRARCTDPRASSLPSNLPATCLSPLSFFLHCPCRPCPVQQGRALPLTSLRAPASPSTHNLLQARRSPPFLAEESLQQPAAQIKAASTAVLNPYCPLSSLLGRRLSPSLSLILSRHLQLIPSPATASICCPSQPAACCPVTGLTAATTADCSLSQQHSKQQQQPLLQPAAAANSSNGSTLPTLFPCACNLQSLAARNSIKATPTAATLCRDP